MSKTFLRAISLLVVVCLVFSFASVVTGASGEIEKISVIVKLDDNTDAQQITKELKKLIPQIEYTYEYSVLLNGFCAIIPVSQLELLKSADGVLAVYADTEYEALSYEETEYTLVYAPGVKPLYSPLNGAGAVVAVIDNGFYLGHEGFTLPDNTEVAILEKNIDEILHFTKASKLSGKTDTKSVYKSSKIPFAFDYADIDSDVKTTSNHGTAMLSLAAGNFPNGEAQGAAPGAQVLAMKVYSDYSTTAKTSAVTAALEDAYILGADAVCLSMGSACGFSQAGLFDSLLEETIDKLYRHGISVVCPAGNNGALGAGSVFDNHYGYFEPLTTMPDSGTVSAPSTSKGALSVANADSFLAYTFAFRLCSEDTYIPFSDSNNTSKTNGGKSFYTSFDECTIEYVHVDGLGAEEDFIKDGERLDLSGKIALIKRGELNFTDKINNAAQCKAKAVIIYDNGQSDMPAIRTAMQLDGALIPAVLISQSDGEVMKNAADKRIYINSKIKYVTDLGITPSVAESSSRGPSPTLDIKPELACDGTDIAVADKNGSYSTVSGSSASAAYIAGLAACVSSKLDMPDDSAKAEKTKAVLMNSAHPMQESKSDGESYYSVTLQGAGYLGVSNYSEPDICITSNSEAKIMLGNNLSEKFDMTVTIENLSDCEKCVNLSVVIGTESYESVKYSELCSTKDSFYKENGQMLYEYLDKDENDEVSFTGECISPLAGANVSINGAELNKNSENYTGYTITLKPGEKRDITLSADISGADISSLEEVFENGMIIQGYIFADTESSSSIPFLGFYGDFYAYDPFDSLLSEQGGIFGATYPYTYFADDFEDYTVILGTNYDISEEYKQKATKPELAVISPTASGAEGAIFLRVALLRNLKSLKAEIYSESGELICVSDEITGMKKAYYDENANVLNAYRIKLWDCRDKDNYKYIYEDGKYTCKIRATDADNREFIKEISFVVDSEKPSLVKYSYRTINRKIYLDVTASDNTFIHKISAYGENNIKFSPLSETMPDDKYLVSEGAGGKYTASFDITHRIGQYVYIEIVDLAFNKNIVRIKV